MSGAVEKQPVAGTLMILPVFQAGQLTQLAAQSIPNHADNTAQRLAFLCRGRQDKYNERVNDLILPRHPWLENLPIEHRT